MMLLEYLLVLTGVLCCTAAPAADIPQGHCKDPPRLADRDLQGDWNAEYYAPGTQATYGCYPGYSRRGSIRYACTNGKWESLGTLGQCNKKSCGYPGDIEFGSFELTEGDQFVFGATVTYSCEEGYKMASKHTTRDCTATGWSGYLPHCEAIKCPPVTVDSDVNLISTSYDEEYSVNQVIRFECKNVNKKLRGASDIVCTPNGKWSAEPPNCEDITCRKPLISHGQVTSAGERFNKDQNIEYTCEEGYKPTRTPRTACTEAGWSPPPVCEEITCQKQAVSNGRILESKDYYSFKETVTLECDEGYVIADTPKDPKSTCTSTGWSPPLQCISKKCDRPDIPNGKISYRTWSFPKYVHGYFDYKCNDDYVAGSDTRVYCDPNGWRDKPRCLRICYVPSDHEFNAYINRFAGSYYLVEGKTLFYQCYGEFRTTSGHDRGYIQCLPDGKLAGEKCIKQCHRPELKNGMYKTDNTVFELEKYLVYECNEGYVSANSRFEGRSKCTGTGWDPKPDCKELTCSVDISTPAETKIFKYGQVVHFKCENNNTLVGSSSSQCFYYNWKPSVPRCYDLSSQSYEKPFIDLEPVKEPTCPRDFTQSETAKVKNPKNKNVDYVNEEEVEIECDSSYKLVGSSKVRCENGTWRSSFWCIKKDPCGRPTEPANGRIVDKKNAYFNTDTINYECNPGYHISGYDYNTCMDQIWLPPPDCIEDSCESPAPLENGIIKESKKIYKHGEKVTFECKEDYTLSGDGAAVCSAGQWLNTPTCVYSSCEQPPKINDGEVRDLKNTKYKTGEKAYYICNPGYSMSKSGADVTTCENRIWTTPPQCKKIGGKCEAPPVVQNGDTTGLRKLHYDSGSFVQYQCANLYILEGNYRIKCEDGEWEKAPICREPCTVTVFALEKNNIELKHGGEKKMYCEHHDHITFSCKKGYVQPSNTLMRVQCVDGVMPLPKCLPPGSCILQELEMSQRNIFYSQSLEIGNGQTIEFVCTEGTVAEGNLKAKCNRGTVQYPNCVNAPPCVLQKEEMEARNIDYDGRTKQIRSGQTITFICAMGTIEEEESLEAKCINGNIKYPKCVIPKPCNISHSILEKNHIELVSQEDQNNTFQHDEIIKVKCRANYKHPGNVQTKCINGMLRSQKCFEKSKGFCRILQNDIDANFLALNEKYNDDVYYEEDDTVTFKCMTGYSAVNELKATCRKPPSLANAKPVLNYPTCKKISDS